LLCLCFFFFFQAEDGIRDRNVTGVQTCALPIYSNCTQHLLCLINFLARNTGVSTHPKNDLLCLCPGFLKTPLPIKGLDVPLLYRDRKSVVYRGPCSWPGLRNFSIAELHPVEQSSSFTLF